MKKSILIIVAILIATSLCSVKGQTNWLLSGNSLSGGEVLGSTSAYPLVFITNNIERARILSNGNFGIGTTAPINTLDVNGGVALGSYAGADATASGCLIASGNIGAGNYQPDELLSAGFPAISNGNISLWSATTGDAVGGSLFFRMRVAGGYSKSILGKIQASSYNSGTGNELNFFVGAWNNNNDAGTSVMTMVEGGNVGIGTTTPGTKLEVDGSSGSTLKIVDGNQGSGEILTSDANGVASWSSPNSLFWKLNGNSGTNPATNFIGTTDNKDVVFKRNGVQSGLLNYNSGNTSWGVSALYASTTGPGNTANGANSLQSNTDGEYNVAIGFDALQSNTNGSFNTATGYYALQANTNSGSYWGEWNSAYGSYALDGNTIGYSNTGFGTSSLATNTTGNYNTALGYQADVYTPGSPNITNLSNATAIGYGTLANTSNKTVLSNASCTWNGTLSNSTWSTGSDARIKNNIKENVPGLSFILQLRPVTYNVDLDKENRIFGIKDSAKWEGKYDVEKIQYTGFIAQEVEAAAEKIGYDFSGLSKPKNEHDIYSLGYASFVVPLVKAVQELNTKNENLQSEIDSLKSQLNKIKSLLSGSTPTGNNSSNGIQNNYNVAELSSENALILNQNDPNPFAEETDITYYLPDNTTNAKIMFYDNTGKVIKSVDLEDKGTGALHVYASDISSGIYTYSLIVNGKTIDTKKMVKMGQ